MNALVHIAPQLPPAIDGVGDYCWNLWKHWPDAEPDWKFLVAHGAQKTHAAWPEISVRQFELGGNSLVAALEESERKTAVLHYVSYAYQPKGMPVWLPGAIEAWKQNNPQRQLVTMFHEMYARSSPLRSPFWVAPFARKIIRELVRLSDAWVTSCDRYFNQLTSEFAARPELGRIIPIGSNIPLAVPLVTKWDRASHGQKFRFVVFGLAKTRLWALERHWKLLRALGEAGVVESITLLGKRNEPDDERAWQRFAEAIGESVVWRRQFDLSAHDLSRELVEHDFGLLANEPDLLTKSGVFAALAGHGVIPIVPASTRAVLPEFVSEAVLSNDEDSKTAAAIVSLLHETARLHYVREQLRAIVAGRLAWPRMAKRWHEVLERANAQPPLPSSPINIPILTSA